MVGVLAGFLLSKNMSYKQSIYIKSKEQYHEYLASRRWQEKRIAVIQRENGICQGCRENPIEHVHHTSYTHCGDELIYQLIGLCGTCHNKTHYITVKEL
jgi:5-methylcytosine-specific restriction endonuclease McrA